MELEGLRAFGSPAEWSEFVERVEKRHEHRPSSTFPSPTCAGRPQLERR